MEKFSIQNRKGLKIIGNIYIPQSPIGLAFVLHGLGGYKEQPGMIALTDTFFANGYTVVNFDATNSFGESEGKYEEATMQLHYEDLVDVIAWARTQEWHKEPFILAGHSLGGYAVARYAEDYPNEVKAVFPFAPVVSGELSHQAYEKLRSEEFKKWKEMGWREVPSVSNPKIIKKIPWSHMEERLKHNLLPQASHLTMPVLLVVGENDTSCPPDMQKTLYNLLPEQKELHIIPGAPHTFREEKDLKQLKVILNNWLKKLP